MDINSLAAILGWVTVVNTVLLLFATLSIWAMQSFAGRVHGRMFSIDPGALPVIYFQWLAQFKLLILVFNLGPYLALRLFL